jgi:hypothetical protein
MVQLVLTGYRTAAEQHVRRDQPLVPHLQVVRRNANFRSYSTHTFKMGGDYRRIGVTC